MKQDEINAVKKAAAKMREQDAMNDEIIEMARQAGASPDGKLWLMYSEDLEAFAKLVAAKEREACAMVCDDIRHTWGYSSETSDWERGTEHCADAIRARGEA